VNRLPSSELPQWAQALWVGYVDLDAGGEDESALDDAERARAQRFAFDELRRRFRQSHAFLRRALGEVLGVAPATLRFTTGEAGRPYLTGGGPDFNLSHSGRWAAVAISPRGRVGIDVEVVRPLSDLWGVARSVFTAAECEVLAPLAEPERVAPFFRGWTRKEALLKASGLGITHHLMETEVTLGGAAEVLRVPEVMRRSTWRLAALPRPDGTEAALALETSG